MVGDVDGMIMHLLKGIPATVWILSSILLMSAQLGPVQSVHEFTAYRMQQFDLYGSQYGIHLLCYIATELRTTEFLIFNVFLFN